MWGLSFPITKALGESAKAGSPGASSWFISAYMVCARFLVGALVLAVTTRARPSAAELAQGSWLGLCTGAGMLLQTDALAYTEASTSAFLTQGYVVFLPIAAVFIDRRPPSIRVAACALLVSIGLAILSRFDPWSVSMGRGELETLGAAACFTVQILLVDARRYSENRSTIVTTVMFAVMALTMLPVLAGTARRAADFVGVIVDPAGAAYLAVIVALPTLGSFLLMNRFQRRVTASEAGIVYATEPVFASALALFVPGLLSRLSHIAYANEAVSSRMVIGGTLVVGANVLLAFGNGPTRAAEAELAA
jgi:drug/metabolite transporter (DMT)-like permease